jgi:hypothetical protein
MPETARQACCTGLKAPDLSTGNRCDRIGLRRVTQFEFADVDGGRDQWQRRVDRPAIAGRLGSQRGHQARLDDVGRNSTSTETGRRHRHQVAVSVSLSPSS